MLEKKLNSDLDKVKKINGVDHLSHKYNKISKISKNDFLSVQEKKTKFHIKDEKINFRLANFNIKKNRTN